MRQLGGQDAMFLWLETPRASMHVGMIFIYDPSTAPGGKVSFEDIVEHVNARLHTAPVFRQRVVEVPKDLDRPYWIEDGTFDLKNHVHCTALPKPGSWNQFCTALTNIHEVPLNRDHPLWELHVIQGLGKMDGLPNGGFAILIKAHHAAVDGTTATGITDSFHSKSPEIKPPEPPKEEWVPEEEPELSEMFSRAAIGNSLVSALGFLSSALRIIPKVPKVLLDRLSELTKSNSLPLVPKTRFGDEVSPHRVFDSRRFALADVRKMSKTIKGGTINDVVMAVCGGVLRKYLLSKNDLPEKPLVAFIPIDTRRKDEEGAGNRVAMMFVSLSTDIDDAVERFHAIHESSEKAKDLTNVIGAREITEINQNIPGAFHCYATRLANEIRLGTKITLWNTVVSNVPGPREQLYLHGAKLTRFMATGPSLDGMGIGFPVMSYNGFIEISVAGCRKMVPDPEFVAELIQESFEELKAALLPTPTTVVAKKTTATKKASPTMAKKATAAKKVAPAAAEKTTATKKAAPTTAKKATAAKKVAPAAAEKTTATKKAAPTTAKKATAAKKVAPAAAKRNTVVKKAAPATAKRATSSKKAAPTTAKKATPAKKVAPETAKKTLADNDNKSNQ